MAKPRKMLGDVTGPSAVAMMALIETQSQATLGQWAVTFAQREIAPIYNARCQESTAISAALAAARQYLEGTVSLKEIKAVVKETNQLAKTYEKDVVAQAAVRAAATACSAVYLPTAALGHVFYAIAAMVYDRVGIQEQPDVYDRLAEETFADILASLQAVAVAEEPQPVKVKWHC